MLRRGFTLADVPARVTWRALKAMLRSPWEDAEHLLAGLFDIAAWLQWSKTADAEHGINQPEPLPRPGDVERQARDVQATIEAARAAGLTGGG